MLDIKVKALRTGRIGKFEGTISAGDQVKSSAKFTALVEPKSKPEPKPESKAEPEEPADARPEVVLPRIEQRAPTVAVQRAWVGARAVVCPGVCR